MTFDPQEQYDKIYRYCYFKLRNRERAEDVTQETFLRYLEHYSFTDTVSVQKCLYTIARNLCVDEYRRKPTDALEGTPPHPFGEEDWIMTLSVRTALARLSREEQELLLLRYVNEVPVAVIGTLVGQSRFSVYRRLTAAVNRFREELRKEESCETLEK